MADGKNIYSELDNIDLDGLFAPPKTEEAKENKEQETEELSKEAIEACLYDKTEECPVCDNKFKTRIVRKSKVKFVKSDTDLRPIFTPIQPDYYDVVICNKCGYAAISSKFRPIMGTQADLVSQKITPKFFPKEYPDVYDANVAIERYKLALLTAVAKNARLGEKAYICLKLAWLYRDLDESANEMTYLKSAYEGFQAAYAADTFPICGLDEPTLTYIMADLARRLGDNTQSIKFLGKVITTRNINPRLKEKALDLKQLLKSQ